MAEAATKMPIKTEAQPPKAGEAKHEWHPLAKLQRQVDRLFEDFEDGFFRFPSFRPLFEIEPISRSDFGVLIPPADVVEKDDAYQITTELPGMDEKNIEVKVANQMLTIRGEKKDEKEEREEGYRLSERRYGSFQRTFRMPEGVDVDKIEAGFKNGLLTVTLPKTAETQQPQKTINVKAA